jgi:hypothetical protein
MAFFGRSVARRHDVDGVYDLRMNGTNATDKTDGGKSCWSHWSCMFYFPFADSAYVDLGILYRIRAQPTESAKLAIGLLTFGAAADVKYPRDSNVDTARVTSQPIESGPGMPEMSWLFGTVRRLRGNSLRTLWCRW